MPLLDTIIHADCLEVMPSIPDHSIDMILCDLPYAKTAAKWDKLIPMERLWAEYKRVIKPRGAIVLTAAQPFTSMLVMSNPKWYRHSWVWDKGRGTGINAKYQPIAYHEDIVVFSGSTICYHPIMKPLDQTVKESGKIKSPIFNACRNLGGTYFRDKRYPTSIIRIPLSFQDHIHPTQKPVALFEYLIRTYSQEGDTILDSASGSATTAVAAIHTNRHFICIEKDAEYWRKSVERIDHLPAWQVPLIAA